MTAISAPEILQGPQQARQASGPAEVSQTSTRWTAGFARRRVTAAASAGTDSDMRGRLSVRRRRILST